MESHSTVGVLFYLGLVYVLTSSRGIILLLIITGCFFSPWGQHPYLGVYKGSLFGEVLEAWHDDDAQAILLFTVLPVLARQAMAGHRKLVKVAGSSG